MSIYGTDRKSNGHRAVLQDKRAYERKEEMSKKSSDFILEQYNYVNKAKELVYKLQAPICDTLMGKGAFDNTDKHYTGMIGMHGTKTTNYGVSKSDLLIAPTWIA